MVIFSFVSWSQLTSHQQTQFPLSFPRAFTFQIIAPPLGQQSVNRPKKPRSQRLFAFFQKKLLSGAGDDDRIIGCVCMHMRGRVCAHCPVYFVYRPTAGEIANIHNTIYDSHYALLTIASHMVRPVGNPLSPTM